MDKDIETVIYTLEFNFNSIARLIEHEERKLKQLIDSSKDYEEMARLCNKLAEHVKQKEAFEFSLHLLKNTKICLDEEPTSIQVVLDNSWGVKNESKWDCFKN